MSVIHFQAEELANLAVLAVGGSTASTDGQERLRYYCGVLADYSAANTRAFCQTYREAAQAVLKEELLRFANRPQTLISASREQATETLALLAYNAVANNGTDFLNGDTAKGLLRIAVQFLR